MSFKPKFRSLAVIFTVEDLDRTQRFYQEVLGLALERYDEFLAIKLSDGIELDFFQGEATRGTSPQIVFGLDEGGIDTVAESLVTQGVQVLTQVSEAPGGWSFEFRDPDGHPLAFYQDGALSRRAP